MLAGGVRSTFEGATPSSANAPARVRGDGDPTDHQQHRDDPAPPQNTRDGHEEAGRNPAPMDVQAARAHYLIKSQTLPSAQARVVRITQFLLPWVGGR
jgi:hypothetical protein